jgi:hypothetical protein
MASNPLTDETPAEPHAELLAQGLTNNSVAPAEPALSSLPAKAILKDKNSSKKNFILL